MHYHMYLNDQSSLITPTECNRRCLGYVILAKTIHLSMPMVMLMRVYVRLLSSTLARAY